MKTDTVYRLIDHTSFDVKDVYYNGNHQKIGKFNLTTKELAQTFTSKETAQEIAHIVNQRGCNFEVEEEMTMNERKEDKVKILELLLPALQATSNLDDLTALHFNPRTEIITAEFAHNSTKTVNVSMDSGTAMIQDLLNHII